MDEGQDRIGRHFDRLKRIEEEIAVLRCSVDEHRKVIAKLVQLLTELQRVG